MAEDDEMKGLAIPFPLEFFVQATPASSQTANGKKRDEWKEDVAKGARARLAEMTDFYFLDRRPLAATIDYFPPDVMQGDVDNIVKFTLDGMKKVVYPDDHVIERVVVQKFEPGVGRSFGAVTPKLAEALDTEAPVVCIRVDSHPGWRDVT